MLGTDGESVAEGDHDTCRRLVTDAYGYRPNFREQAKDQVGAYAEGTPDKGSQYTMRIDP